MAEQFTTTQKTYPSSINTLGFKLYHQLRFDNESKNLLFSPFSVCTSLSMAYMGSHGDTAKQIETVMNLPVGSDENIHREIKFHNANLIGRSNVYLLKLANRLYCHKKFQIKPEFLNTAQKFYIAKVESVEFERDSNEPRDAINGWIEQQTDNRVKGLISPTRLIDGARLVLVSALYFRAEWQHPFCTDLTSEHLFYLTQSESIYAKMMHQTHNFEFLHDKHLQCKILLMKFKQHKLEMMFVLPDHIAGLYQLECHLSSEVMQTWYAEVKTAKVRVMLPKFKLTQNWNLSPNLMDIGMTELFSPSADLSGISDDDDLYMSEVAHKTFLQIDENGCDAGAALCPMLESKDRAKSQPEPKIFKADHPFLFFIHSMESGAMIFMGRVKRLNMP